MLYYKIDVLAALKAAGINTNRIKTEKIFSGETLVKLLHGEIVGAAVLDRLCALLNCQPGDLIAWKPDADESPKN